MHSIVGLETEIDGADVTRFGRLFQTLEAAVAKDLSPTVTVDSRYRGVTSSKGESSLADEMSARR